MGSVRGFLEAERGLFDRYGLERETHRLELSEPALTARVLVCGRGEPLGFGGLGRDSKRSC